ncbi:MAG: hypothetical protein ACK46Q_08640 [Hyphomonas sp.]
MAKFEDQVSAELTRLAREQELMNEWAKARDLALADVFTEISPSFRKHGLGIVNNVGRIEVFDPNSTSSSDPRLVISCFHSAIWRIGDEIYFSIGDYGEGGCERAQIMALAANYLGNWIARNKGG